MIEIKKVDILSMAKIYGTIMAILAFIAALIINLAFLGYFMHYPTFSGFSMHYSAMNFMPNFPILSLITFPIIYGILGFITGAISAFLYNIIASKIGGIKVEIKQ
jgi:hypothetical protein